MRLIKNSRMCELGGPRLEAQKTNVAAAVEERTKAQRTVGVPSQENIGFVRPSSSRKESSLLLVKYGVLVSHNLQLLCNYDVNTYY